MQLISLAMIRSKADLTLVLNEQLLKDLQKKGFLSEKISVLGGGIEYEKIVNLIPKKKIKFQAVFLGRLHVTKGIFDTIPIWKKVIGKIPNARLAIIGDGSIDIKKRLEEKIRESYLQANIKILGYLPYDEVYTIMKQADLFLFLDHEAGWGLAVAEAMACGLPVVGYDIDVLGTVFKQGYSAIIPLGDHDRFSKKVIQLLQDEKYRKKLSYEAVYEAAKHDWKITSQKFSQLLDKQILQYE
jgi:glycosyltransferase involved in cell wall biosynthesis